MKTHTIDSTYRQFYIADAGLDPDAPEDWSDQHVLQRYNALTNIVALCPEGDITARVKPFAPGETYQSEQEPDFEVRTQITILSGRLGVFGWPREALEEYCVQPGKYLIYFRGYNLCQVNEERDFYTVEFEHAA
ncbi:hypothetical protein H5185_11710 [Shewanella sp. SG44-6]|uniref:hypothetical protein n=1 Tax=Shewanella sp. SG44-6 TaxID=2760959 RepID=UPI0016030C39|nr:hypothetical protein [Shewanella sp. SG44-6]MBB1390079.1 hypothetical protein [Shewanella sp. SG44-6]